MHAGLSKSCWCRAVTEAKNEVMERKKDLDTTKEKMDKLVEKLYLGRSATLQAWSLLHACCFLAYFCLLSLLMP